MYVHVPNVQIVSFLGHGLSTRQKLYSTVLQVKAWCLQFKSIIQGIKLLEVCYSDPVCKKLSYYISKFSIF